MEVQLGAEGGPGAGGPDTRPDIAIHFLIAPPAACRGRASDKRRRALRIGTSLLSTLTHRRRAAFSHHAER